MSENDSVISRIQHASHMKSIFGFSLGEYYTEKELRKRYKKLALLVHPDKCKSDGAEAAFQTLNNAFETLILRLPEVFQEIDTTTATKSWNQRKDSNAVNTKVNTSSERGGHDNSSKCDKRERHDEERNFKESFPETRNEYPSDPKIAKNRDEVDKRKTTRCEFSASWAQAEDEYIAEDLQRKISREVRMKLKLMKRQAEEMQRAEHLQSEFEELQKNVESRASSWKVWKSDKKYMKMGGSRNRGERSP